MNNKDKSSNSSSRWEKLKWTNLQQSNFSKPELLIFVLIFGLIGYFVFQSFAATPVVATLEAEHMTLSTGATIVADSSASGGEAVKQVVPGKLSGSINLPSSSTSLNLRVKAQQCNNTYWPWINLSVDGTSLVDKRININSWGGPTITESLASGLHNITIDVSKKSTANCNPILYLDVMTFYGSTSSPSPAPTVSLSASPNIINAGSASTLTWSSTNATSCTASGAWSGNQSTSGSISTGALNQNSTYSLSCSGSGGTATVSTTITVNSTSGGGGGSGSGGINSTTWAPNSGAYVFERSNFGTSASNFQDFQSRETQLGGKFDGYMDYVSCNTSSSELADARSAGLAGTPFIVLSWCTGNNPTTIIPSIASGGYDTDITNFANAVKSQLSGISNIHVLIRPFWEFNYQGSEWDASNYGGNYAQFGQAFTRFENIFASNSVPNVKWLLNTIRIGSSSSDSPIPYYNAVLSAGGHVDWIGIDAYPKNQWLSLPTMMTTSGGGSTFNWYSWAASTGKPLIVGETSILPCSAYANCNQTRANWWQDNQNQLSSYPALKAVEIFDSSTQALNWQIDQTGPTNDSGSSALSAYSAWAKSSYFNPLGLR